MATQTKTATAPQPELAGAQKIQQLRELVRGRDRRWAKRRWRTCSTSYRRRFRNRRRQSKAPAGLGPVSASARS